MARKLKSRLRQPRESGRDKLLRFGHSLFLAGLGAAAKVVEDGPKVFSALVKEGESWRARVADDTGAAIKRARPIDATDLEKIEQIFTERTARVLDGLDVATQTDIQILRERLEALEEKARILREQIAQSKTPSDTE